MSFAKGQRSRTPIKKAHIPIINFEQLRKEQQYLQSAFQIYDSYQQNNLVFNSLRQIEKNIDAVYQKPLRKNLSKPQKNYLKFSEIIQRPQQRLIKRFPNERLNSTCLLTNMYQEPELIWNKHKARYGKKENITKPARHPIKLQQTLNLKPEKYKRLLSASLRNWV